ncbi:MAG: substrate-binding domain-containing protein [Spirochaetales bacterium]|jgi:simple sugar transport system substrate-binding protein|nr:substrate-binding domain-containing protein [Spirochaetales bacterium]
MKSFLYSLVFVVLAACAGGEPPRESAEPQELLAQFMPEAMADGIVKVAIVRNLAAGDHTRQFLEGCVSEGRALGFTVDTFVTDGNRDMCRSLLARITEADYDGLILSNGEADFTYTSLKGAAEKGIKIVTFDAIPYEDGDTSKPILAGVTSTAQEDSRLARISLDSIVSYFPSDRLPVRVIRVWSGPGMPPLDRRLLVYNEFVQEGKIREIAHISPRDFSFARSGTREALTALLARFPPGSVDAIWASYDEFAKGCIDALTDAGRRDIIMASIDISNDDMKLMLANPHIWVSTAAVDPKLIGIVNIRLLAAKLAGEETPQAYNFNVQNVHTVSLSPSITMANIASVVPGWGQEAGLFDSYPWMEELKKAVAEKTVRGNRSK